MCMNKWAALRQWLVAVCACTMGRWTFAAPPTVVLDFTLDHLSGNITPEQRSMLLQSSDGGMEAEYWPDIKIPGVNARVERSGFLLLPGLKPDRESLWISAAEVDAVGGKMRFAVPVRSPKRGFPLQVMSIQLPFEALPNALRDERGNGFSLRPVLREEAKRVMPVWVASNYRALGGTLELGGAGHFAPSSGMPTELASNRWEPPYIFYPRHRYAAYGNISNYPFQLLQELKAPLPAAWKNMAKIHRANIYGGWMDSHWIEIAVASAELEKSDGCLLNDVGYRILWVDGGLVSYAEDNSDPRDGQCRSWHRGLDMDEDNRVIRFADSVTDWINGGTKVTYRMWNSTCPTAPNQPLDNCTLPGPDAAQTAAIRQSAQQLRSWFLPSQKLQALAAQAAP